MTDKNKKLEREVEALRREIRTLEKVKTRAEEYQRLRNFAAENRNPLDREVIGGELARLMIEMRDADLQTEEKLNE